MNLNLSCTHVSDFCRFRGLPTGEQRIKMGDLQRELGVRNRRLQGAKSPYIFESRTRSSVFLAKWALLKPSFHRPHIFIGRKCDKMAPWATFVGDKTGRLSFPGCADQLCQITSSYIFFLERIFPRSKDVKVSFNLRNSPAHDGARQSPIGSSTAPQIRNTEDLKAICLGFEWRDSENYKICFYRSRNSTLLER